jgi:predicted Fe-S protein YdhL (DUF1289 family)
MIDDDHANSTNPCIGICASDDNGFCIGCFRTSDESGKWYEETIEWREDVLKELVKREQDIFGKDN